MHVGEWRTDVRDDGEETYELCEECSGYKHIRWPCEIFTLSQRVQKLEEALRPIVEMLGDFDKWSDDAWSAAYDTAKKALGE